MSGSDQNADALGRYYRWHARLYDLTRWAFLFGRRRLIDEVVSLEPAPSRILEIGCGTGRNLAALAAAFPEAQLTGLDLSQDMLERARPKIAPYGDRVTLLHQRYDGPLGGKEDGFDLIVLSYALSMINPGYDEVLAFCRSDLRPGGRIAVVDFHETPWTWFRRWMGMNHVRMEGQILARLEGGFDTAVRGVERAYGGLWHYLVYVGH